MYFCTDLVGTLFTRMLRHALPAPARFGELAGELFRAMAAGGVFRSDRTCAPVNRAGLRTWKEIPELSPQERKVLPLLAVVIVWVGLAGDAVAQGSVASDRAALEALYDATGSAGWTDDTNWKSSAALGDWYGVTTDVSGRVTELRLGGNGLTGSIPTALRSLGALQWLDLSSNELSGPVPRGWGACSHFSG